MFAYTSHSTKYPSGWLASSIMRGLLSHPLLWLLDENQSIPEHFEFCPNGILKLIRFCFARTKLIQNILQSFPGGIGFFFLSSKQNKLSVSQLFLLKSYGTYYKRTTTFSSKRIAQDQDSLQAI